MFGSRHEQRMSKWTGASLALAITVLLAATGQPARAIEMHDIAVDPQVRETDPSAVYNPEEEQYLVAFAKIGTIRDIYAQLIDVDGISASPAILIISNAYRASVALNPTKNEYFIVWIGSDGVQGAILGKNAQGELEKKTTSQIIPKSFWGHGIGTESLFWDAKQQKYVLIYSAVLGGCVDPDSEGTCLLRSNQIRAIYISADGIPGGNPVNISSEDPRMFTELPKVAVDRTHGNTRYAILYPSFYNNAPYTYFVYTLTIIEAQDGILNKIRENPFRRATTAIHRARPVFDVAYHEGAGNYYLRMLNPYDAESPFTQVIMDGAYIYQKELTALSDRSSKSDIQMSYSKVGDMLSVATSKVAPAFDTIGSGGTVPPNPITETTLVGGSMFSLEGDHSFSDVTVFYTEQYSQAGSPVDLKVLFLKFGQ